MRLIPDKDRAPNNTVLTMRDNGLVCVDHWIGRIWWNSTGSSFPFEINGIVMQIENGYIRQHHGEI